MKFDSDFIRELKARCRIEDVISRTLQVKHAGSNLVACCPFHSEKTPSFTIFPATQSYYCFGCSEGGDVITYVMKTENLEYPEAVRKLAESCGISVPQNDDPQLIERQKHKARLLALNLFAAKYFREKLFSPEGEKAMDYLVNKRQLSLSTIKHFGLGYASQDWTDGCDAMLAAGFTKQEILDGFFAGISNKTGRLFDYFRDRIMFPYFDINGNVIAFGGRIMGNGEPKYLNTKDTAIFKKGLNLYALNYAKNVSDSTFLLCEGYMDVISLHQAGFNGALASCGTALTQEQAHIISRYAEKVVICYDSDKAGTIATQRASDMLGKLDVEVAVLDHSKMKGAKDPDEFIKNNDAAAFSLLLDSSGSQTEYMLSKIASKYNLDMPDDKIRFVKEASGFVATLESKVAREVYSSNLAQMTGISEKSVLDEVNHAVARLGTASRKRFEQQRMLDISRVSDRVNLQAAKNLRAVTAEENLIGILAAYPELIETTSKKIKPEEFVTDLDRNIYSEMLNMTQNGQVPEISALSEFFDTSVMSRIYELKNSRMKLTHNDMNEIQQLCEIIREENSKHIKASEMSDEDFLKEIENMKIKKQ